MKIYKLYTELLDYKPLIWRRLLAADSMKLPNLAYVLMALYEMEGEHMFNFYSPERDTYYALPSKDAADKEINAKKTALRDVIKNEQQNIIFNYDFGDSWEIEIKAEEITDSDLAPQRYPVLLEGDGYGIIEDCGGVDALAIMAEAFKKKKGPEYEEYSDWLGRNNLDLKTFQADKKNLRAEMAFFRSIYEHTEPPAKWEWVVDDK